VDRAGSIASGVNVSEHQLVLPDGERINYRMERRNRKTIGLRIGADGLVVHAPRLISQVQLEYVLLQKSHWIRKKLLETYSDIPPPLSWADGMTLHYLGETIRLRVSQDTADRRPLFEDGELHLQITKVNVAEAIARKVTDWYKRIALPYFSQRLEKFSDRLGEPLPKLMLSSARTRWGSCNSKRVIRINWRLIQAPPHIIDYVICHELAHLKEMNHSPRFWNVVKGLYPDYPAAERELKRLSSHLHRL
jgi:predicted metal-dependent hydrolase